MRDTERERGAETQAEGEAGSMQGARRGTPSWDPDVGLHPGTLGSHPGSKDVRTYSFSPSESSQQFCFELSSLKSVENAPKCVLSCPVSSLAGLTGPLMLLGVAEPAAHTASGRRTVGGRGCFVLVPGRSTCGFFCAFRKSELW